MIGRHDNALANLRAAAKAGKKFGAMGYLITDWGDGGHPQPLAVSWPMFLAGAALAWNAKSFDERKLVPVLSRDVFGDSTGESRRRRSNLVSPTENLALQAPNETPLGTVIAAPPPEARELFCRNGLKWFAKIPAKNIRAALKEIEKQRTILNLGRRHAVPPKTKILMHGTGFGGAHGGAIVPVHALAAGARGGKNIRGETVGASGIRELRKLDKDFRAYWPLRNKATPQTLFGIFEMADRGIMKN